MLLLVGRADALPIDGIHNIQHVVVITQENRSFDSYFGTYPGANGIPAGVCVPDPLAGKCVAPFHDPAQKNFGGPHGHNSALTDIDGGRMDGFVAAEESAKKCSSPTGPNCTLCEPTQTEPQERCNDVMGYHDAREIPNYWTYAKNFVLQDDMFESVTAWSGTSHDYLVSGWGAKCPAGDPNPLDCVNSVNTPYPPTTNSWTDITYLLNKAKVSWRYYVLTGTEPDCESDESLTCSVVNQSAKTPGIWNPLPYFTDVKEDAQLEDIQSLTHFYTAVHERSACALPNVSWIEPSGSVSEHPPATPSQGQAYVTTLVNSIMRSPCWQSTAIFISWDDWGGFYDHVVPPSIDANGYGLRVPGLVISPYARAGYIDHQQLSHDAYLKFIEDDFLAGARLNPATDGRPDKRPDVREEAPGLGSLANDFDFSQAPLPAVLLSPHPEPGPASTPPGQRKPPLVETRAASLVTQTAATLNATVNPNEGAVSSCYFEYGTSASYGSTVACGSSPGAGSSAVEVSARLVGLAANRSYHFRVVAGNEAGKSVGADQTFTTLPEPPTVETRAASLVTQTSATLNATVNPNEASVSSCYFEYGTSASYGSTVACGSSPGAGSSAVEVSARLVGLAANRSYHFRVVAGNEAGTSAGADQTFTTLPEPPTVETRAASLVTQTAATLNATVNPNEGSVSSCYFEYGTSVFYEASAPCTPLPQLGASPVEVSARLEGLFANTVYHFRVIASNEGGKSVGADQTFTTPSEPPTVSQVTPALGPESGGTSVTITGAHLTGASAVAFGSRAAASFAVTSPSTITAVSPPGTGSVDVIVTTAGGASRTNVQDLFSYLASPAVTEVRPLKGPVGGGTSVTISGANFVVGQTAVAFGSSGAASVRVNSATSLTAVSPAEPAGAVDVRATTPGGTSAITSADRFRFSPTVTGLTPNAGSTAGGAFVTVTGTGFAVGSNTTVVRFGMAKVAPVDCASSTECTVVSPPAPSGRVDVTATVDSATSAITASDQFTYF